MKYIAVISRAAGIKKSEVEESFETLDIEGEIVEIDGDHRPFELLEVRDSFDNIFSRTTFFVVIILLVADILLRIGN